MQRTEQLEGRLPGDGAHGGGLPLRALPGHLGVVDQHVHHTSPNTNM